MKLNSLTLQNFRCFEHLEMDLHPQLTVLIAEKAGCGQKKKNGLLPIEPRKGCNAEWQLSTDGTIQPISGLTKRRTHDVKQTRDMLGLNADTNLVIEREKWVKQAQFILENQPAYFDDFLQEVPFRYILQML